MSEEEASELAMLLLMAMMNAAVVVVCLVCAYVCDEHAADGCDGDEAEVDGGEAKPLIAREGGALVNVQLLNKAKAQSTTKPKAQSPKIRSLGQGVQ